MLLTHTYSVHTASGKMINKISIETLLTYHCCLRFAKGELFYSDIKKQTFQNFTRQAI